MPVAAMQGAKPAFRGQLGGSVKHFDLQTKGIEPATFW